MMLLNAAKNPLFRSQYVYFGMSALLLFTTFIIKIGMKDVIKDRRNAGNESEDEKVTIGFIVK